MLKKISIRNLTELNNTMCAAAAEVSELVKANKLPKAKKEPWRKKRLEGKLKELNRDLDSLNNLFEKRSIEKKIQHSKKETQHCKGRNEATNRVAKTKQFNSRINQYQQNRFFLNNQGQFFHD